ncbi:MAG TPA: hypothetical protein VFJ16_16750 [Longimicrobium sp.]|nr:hypothetical protein [Longimicrobium sp.]
MSRSREAADHAALRLFDACAPAMFALAAAVSGNADAAEDAVVDAFAAAMRSPVAPTRAALAMQVRAAALAHASPAVRWASGAHGDGERCAVQLALFARLTVPEIAAALSISPGEVKRRLAAGLRSTRAS